MAKVVKTFAENATVRDVIGLFLILAFIGAMVALLWKAIPPENEQLLAYMLGQLSGFVSGVVAYHYITKAGDKELQQQQSENTGEAFKAVRRVAEAATQSAETRPTGQPGDPVHTKEENA